MQRLCEEANALGRAAYELCGQARSCKGALWDDTGRDEHGHRNAGARWGLTDACAAGTAHPEACEQAEACNAQAATCSRASDAGKAALATCHEQSSVCALL